MRINSVFLVLPTVTLLLLHPIYETFRNVSQRGSRQGVAGGWADLQVLHSTFRGCSRETYHLITEPGWV